MRLMITTMLGAAGLAAFAAYAPMTAPPKVAAVDVTVNEDKAVPIETVQKTWKCPGCSPNEKYVLEQLQAKTRISSRNALATILGNIKSESNFHPNICEGGARVPYHACRRGGYGLIQWTSVGRYRNLGKFATRYGYDPSSLEGQTAYEISACLVGSGMCIRDSKKYFIEASFKGHIN